MRGILKMAKPSADEIVDTCEEDCPECGGEGFIEDECFEDTCCCADPATEHGLITCPMCGGK